MGPLVITRTAAPHCISWQDVKAALASRSDPDPMKTVLLQEIERCFSKRVRSTLYEELAHFEGHSVGKQNGSDLGRRRLVTGIRSSNLSKIVFEEQSQRQPSCTFQSHLPASLHPPKVQQVAAWSEPPARGFK